MNRFLRYLRIAFSATCLVVAVLLCALWARSYTWWDTLYMPTSIERWVSSPETHSGLVQIDSASGRVVGRYATGSGTWKWHYTAALNGRYWLGSTTEEATENRNKGIGGFAVYRSGGGLFVSIQVPYWFLTLLATSLAGVCWLPYSIHFSLRTLLIATTLIAVVLGLIVWVAR